MDSTQQILATRIFEIANQYRTTLAEVERRLQVRQQRLASGDTAPVSNMGVELAFDAAAADRYAGQLDALVRMAADLGVPREITQLAMTTTEASQLFEQVWAQEPQSKYREKYDFTVNHGGLAFQARSTNGCFYDVFLDGKIVAKDVTNRGNVYEVVKGLRIDGEI